jgi:hypothetical protein
MIKPSEAKLAYQSALMFINELYEPDRVVDPVIEEVTEPDDDDDETFIWVTLSFFLFKKDMTKKAEEREYKIFRVDKEYSILSMANSDE